MKIYENPQTRIVFLRGPVLMLGGSNTVNDYQRGSENDILIGDTDE